MSDSELEQNTKIGSLFCLNTVLEYSEVLTVYLEDKKDKVSKYQYNKNNDVIKACRTLYNSLFSGLTKGMDERGIQIVNNAIKTHENIITDFFILDEKDQKRVSGLISKIKKEKCNGKN